MPTPVNVPESVSSARPGTAAAVAIDVIEGDREPPTPPPTGGPPPDAVARCENGAEEGQVINDLYDLLNLAVSEVSDRVRADRAYLAAQERTSECLRESGLDAGQVINADLAEAAAAISIYLNYETAEVDRDTAIRQLTEVRIRQESMAMPLGQVAACERFLVEAEGALVIAEQEAYMTSHPGYIAGVAEQFRSKLEPLREHLPEGD
jgi:hypothetical protein